MRNESPGQPVPRAEWSIVAHRRGVPWWGAVAVAVVLTALGAGIDLLLGDTLTTIFQVFYGLGCVAAVLAVAQRGLFAAMVQPPLVLAAAVPAVVLLLGGPGDSSTRGKVIATVIPLVNGFPTMAVATLVTIAIGILRIRTRRAARPAHTSRSPRTPAARPAGATAPRRTGARRAAPARAPAGGQPGRGVAAAPDGRSPWQRDDRDPPVRDGRESPRRDGAVPRPGEQQDRDPRPRRERPVEPTRAGEPVAYRPATRDPRPARPVENPRTRQPREPEPRAAARDRHQEQPPSRWQEPSRPGSAESRRRGHRYR